MGVTVVNHDNPFTGKQMSQKLTYIKNMRKFISLYLRVNHLLLGKWGMEKRMGRGRSTVTM